MLLDHDTKHDLQQAEKILATLQLKDALSLLAWSSDATSSSADSKTSPKARSPKFTKARFFAPPEIIDAVRVFFDAPADWDPCGEMTDEPTGGHPAISHDTDGHPEFVADAHWQNRVFMQFPGDGPVAAWIERTLREFGQTQDREAILFLSESDISKCEPLLDPYPRVVLRELSLQSVDFPNRKTRKKVHWLVGLITRERLVKFHDAFHMLGPVFAPVPFFSENNHA